MARTLARLLAGVIGVLALLLAARIWMSPAGPAAQLGLQGVGGLGAATLRADIGGFFAAGGLFALLGAIRSDGRLLLTPIALLGLALVGRLVTVFLDGYQPAMLQPMVVEAVLVVVLFWARRTLR